MIALAILAALGLIGFGMLIHGMCVVSKHSDVPPKAVKMEYRRGMLVDRRA